MTTFRTAFPRCADEAAADLHRAVTAGERPLVVGGGTLTVPALTRGEVVTAHVVDLGRAGLANLDIDGDTVRIGALVSYQQLLESQQVQAKLPLLYDLCGGITGGIQIRNQGTVVGSLCAGRPQSDVPAALVALDADVVIQSVAGTRVLNVRSFLQGAGRTALAADEFVSAITVPVQSRRGGYVKLKFAESSWPVVTAAALPDRIVLGGVADVPQRVELCGGTDSHEAAWRRAVADACDRLEPGQRWSDLRADWGYRRRVAPEIAVRAMRAAGGDLS